MAAAAAAAAAACQCHMAQAYRVKPRHGPRQHHAHREVSLSSSRLSSCRLVACHSSSSSSSSSVSGHRSPVVVGEGTVPVVTKEVTAPVVTAALAGDVTQPGPQPPSAVSSAEKDEKSAQMSGGDTVDKSPSSLVGSRVPQPNVPPPSSVPEMSVARAKDNDASASADDASASATVDKDKDKEKEKTATTSASATPVRKKKKKVKAVQKSKQTPLAPPPPSLVTQPSLASFAAATFAAVTVVATKAIRTGAPWRDLEKRARSGKEAASSDVTSWNLGMRASASSEAATLAAVLDATGLRRAGLPDSVANKKEEMFTASADSLAALRSPIGALGALPSEQERVAAEQATSSAAPKQPLETPKQRARRLKRARDQRAREMEEQRRVNAEREAMAAAEAERASKEKAEREAREAEEERKRREELRRREAIAAAAREEARQRDREEKEAERKRLAEQREAQRLAVNAARDALLVQLQDNEMACRVNVRLTGRREDDGSSAVVITTTAEACDSDGDGSEAVTTTATSEVSTGGEEATSVDQALRRHAALGLNLPLPESRPNLLGTPDDAFGRHVARSVVALALPSALAGSSATQRAARLAMLDVSLVASTYPSEGASPLTTKLDAEDVDPRTAEAGRALLFSTKAVVPRGAWTQAPMDRTARSLRNAPSGAGEAAATAVLELLAAEADDGELGKAVDASVEALRKPLDRLRDGDFVAFHGDGEPSSYWAVCRIMLAAAHLHDRTVALLAADAASAAADKTSARLSDGAVSLARALRKLAEAAHAASGQEDDERTAALAELLFGDRHPVYEASARIAASTAATKALRSGDDENDAPSSTSARSMPERLWAYRSLCSSFVEMGCVAGASAMARAAAAYGGSSGSGGGDSGGEQVSFLAILRKPGNASSAAAALDPRIQELRSDAGTFLVGPGENDASSYKAFASSLSPGEAEASEAADKARSEGVVKELERAAVPHVVDASTFWTRYLYRLSSL
ncbi:BSD domain-containing protein [Pycnococcus provasolii]